MRVDSYARLENRREHDDQQRGREATTPILPHQVRDGTHPMRLASYFPS
jgi:hypothetical protein